MEGLFDLVAAADGGGDLARKQPNAGSGSNPGSSGTGSRKRYGKNFSPVALKNRIEVLQNESKK